MSELKTRNGSREFDIHGDVARIKAAVSDATRDIKGKAGDMLTQSVENLKDHSVAAKDNVARYTAEKPFRALGVALLAGTVLGFLLRSKK
jgi:ElaB/YqjD/DUF883 family membrane-anchored ribosome-binding protein